MYTSYRFILWRDTDPRTYFFSSSPSLTLKTPHLTISRRKYKALYGVQFYERKAFRNIFIHDSLWKTFCSVSSSFIKKSTYTMKWLVILKKRFDSRIKERTEEISLTRMSKITNLKISKLIFYQNKIFANNIIILYQYVLNKLYNILNVKKILEALIHNDNYKLNHLFPFWYFLWKSRILSKV